MKEGTDRKRYSVPALERGIRILQLFDRTRTEISGVDVVRELRLPRATAFRLLQSLEHLGCLRRAESGAYRVGPAVLRLGFEFVGTLDVAQVARGVVERLRDRTGCSAQLVIRDGRDVVVVLKAVGPGAFSTSVNVGSRLPAHATVLGRVLLCELTDSELTNLYPELDLPRVGNGSPRTLAELKELLCNDLARGYAVSESLFEQGISAVAAPVRAADGDFVAAVSLTVYKATLEPSAWQEQLVQEVVAAATEISERLGNRQIEQDVPVPRAGGSGKARASGAGIVRDAARI
jgi:DNA-binding IclR family transcriptional regulator